MTFPSEVREGFARLVSVRAAMLQALHEVEGDHIRLEQPDTVATCCFCSADEGAWHEPECTMVVVLAAIDRAEGREPRECYVVGDRQTAAQT